MDWLQLVILALATYRVMRLIVEDDIVEPLRERTIYHLDPNSKLRTMFDCPWCVGFWLSLVATYLYWQWPTEITWLALPFAISTVIGLVAGHEGD